MSNLLRHKKVHLGIKPYQCNRCQKNFSSVSNLNQHLMIHDRKSNRYKFVCFIEGCYQSYFYICTLKNHIVKFHHSEYSRLEQDYKNRSFIEIYKMLSAKKTGSTLDSDIINAGGLQKDDKVLNNECGQEIQKKEKFRLSKNLFKIVRSLPNESKISENCFSESHLKKQEVEGKKISPVQESEPPQYTDTFQQFNIIGINNNEQNIINNFSTTRAKNMEIEIINLTFNYLLYNYTVFNELNKISELTRLHSNFYYNLFTQNHNQNKVIIAILYKELSFNVLKFMQLNNGQV